MLLNGWQPHTVATSTRLRALGITPQHVQKYVAGRWLEAVAAGVFKRPNDKLTWQGALYSLQTQLGLRVHVGALTALAGDGATHYLRLGGERVFLFSDKGVKMPAWFKAQGWQLHHTQTTLLPPDLGVRDAMFDGFPLLASAPERAILEALHLAPKAVDLMEVFDVVEGLRTLRPKLMQELLEACRSIKVRRLFLFMADKASLPVLSHLDLDRIELGSGDRAVVSDGAYVAKYRLSVPKGLVSNG